MGLELKEPNKPKVNVPSKGTFKPTKLMFNFSFITSQRKYNLDSKGITSKVKAKLVERLFFLSTEDFDALLGFSKEKGLECLDDNIVHYRINQDFIKTGRINYCLDGTWVFRLSNMGRVLGKISNKVFYVLCIDTSFDAYKHE